MSQAVPRNLGHRLTCGNGHCPKRRAATGRDSMQNRRSEACPVSHPSGAGRPWDTAPLTGRTRRPGAPLIDTKERNSEMTNLLAIDPGNEESGWVIIDLDTRRPLRFGKTPNIELLEMLQLAPIGCEHIAIEMIASYGMPVGAEVFETCVWIGRFYETVLAPHTTVDLIKRHPVKMHHCHNSKAKDSNITQALVDRFAPGQPNHGKGTKANPGWFYGFKADIWQAYALAVYAADQRDPKAVAS